MAWKEEFSRDIARVLMEQYSSVAEALFELVDNPIDFRRRGRVLQVTVEIDKDRDVIVVEDHGGAGMDAEGIARWLRWGDRSIRQVKATDIGRWRVGGKAAAGYLADRIEMYAKAAGRTEVWFFRDEGWSTRSVAADWGEPAPLPRDVPLPRSLSGRLREDGYVRIELSGLRSRVYNVEDLRWYVSNTYRVLLDRGDIDLSINGIPVEPMQLPRSSAFDEQAIDLRTSSGRRIRGWVGRLNRDAVVGPSARRRIEGGLRCLYQGRMVGRPYYFGHAGDAKGSLASLIGEVELGFLQPNIMKTDFDRSTEEWGTAEKALNAFLAPIVRQFREAAEKTVITREQRKALSEVCEELAEVFRELREDRSWSAARPQEAVSEKGNMSVDPPVPGYGGRAVGQARGDSERQQPGDVRSHGERQSQPTPLARPENAIGRMIRLINKVSGGGIKPPAILDAFDPSQRSGWRTQGGESKIIVNTAFPLYEAFGGSPPYLAETVIMKIAEGVEGEAERTLEDYVAEVNQVTAAWARMHRA
jgi:hypothetical protein